MTTPVASNTTDELAIATASLTRTKSSGPAHQDGTLVNIGSGVYVTAGHVMYQYVNPGSVRSAESYTFHVAEGLDGARDVTTLSDDFSATFHNPSWGSSGGSDMSFALTADTTEVSIPMIVYADADDASGTLTSYGFPVDGGFDGETMVQVTGNLTANSHTDIPTSNGNMSVLLSDIGMQVFSGQSGSGVWITNDVDGDGQNETYLAGVVSLDIQYVGGLHATGFEPIGDIYADLGAEIEAAGLSSHDFARATLVSGQSLASSFTTVTGTVLNEDLLGGINADTLDGGGGADSLFGGAGADVLTDGDGKDVLSGGTGADVFALSSDYRPDFIVDFEQGIDLIDVSAWQVTSLSELEVLDHRSGRVTIRLGKEAVSVDDGARGLTAASFDASDFIFAPGTPALPVIEGTSGNDRLIGSTLAEELRDLAGADNMFGKGGADVFVLSLDGNVDSIKDFEHGQDLIDLSAWGATALEDLTMTDHHSGKIFIDFGAERLLVNNAERSLTSTELSDSDFLFA